MLGVFYPPLPSERIDFTPAKLPFPNTIHLKTHTPILKFEVIIGA
jgi:hypothetical protein